MALAEILYQREEIRARVTELAGEISLDLQGERPVLVSVLKGSVIFLSDLMRALSSDADIDFMSISSYSAGTTPSGVVRIVKDLEQPIESRRVIVVEDMVDTGFSLSYLLRILGTRGPSKIQVCSLVDKTARRIADLEVEFAGFRTDEFLIGYGLDFQGRYRNLPYLARVTDISALAAKPDALISLFEEGAWRADSK